MGAVGRQRNRPPFRDFGEPRVLGAVAKVLNGDRDVATAGRHHEINASEVHRPAGCASDHDVVGQVREGLAVPHRLKLKHDGGPVPRVLWYVVGHFHRGGGTHADHRAMLNERAPNASVPIEPVHVGEQTKREVVRSIPRVGGRHVERERARRKHGLRHDARVQRP